MFKLAIKGLTEVDGMKFHCIEGGFGEGKRAMLIKEIAEIHNQPWGEINRRINENSARFKHGIDIIDIKPDGFEPLGQKLGFTRQSFNQSNNVYVLSERGYAKLLKLLEDDMAWEQYEKLVDGYFAMRKSYRKRYKTISFILKDELQAARAISEVTGIKLGIACATALRRVENMTGNSLEDYRLLLPAADHDTGKLKVSEIGEKLGGIKSIEVNKRLADVELQYQNVYTRKSSKTGEIKTEKQWRLTEKGKQYAEEFPYNRNGHSGYEIRWSETVINVLNCEVLV